MSWARDPGPDGLPKGWWAKTVVAGLIGGVAMMLFLMASSAAMGRGWWFPVNGVATVLPVFQPEPGGLLPGDFRAGPSITGWVVHLLIAAVMGVIYAAGVEAFMRRQARSWLWEGTAGLVYGTFVWMFLGFGGVYLAGRQEIFGTATFFLGHLIYGLVLGLSLATLTSKKDLVVTFAPEEPARRPVERR